jgi:hypothetical protein
LGPADDRLEGFEWSGRHSSLTLEGGFLLPPQGGPVGATEIIVIGAVVLVMSGMGALVYYANTPAKDDPEHASKKSK